MDEQQAKLLIIEPFYGGSHKQLIELLCLYLEENTYVLITMTAKKWHWRARTSALYISQEIPQNHNFEVLICSSVLPLAELIGLRSDLANLKKVVYSHENQLEYPVRIRKDRDYQYGYNEILTCLVADKVFFNSFHNMNTFILNINKHMNAQPDYKMKNMDLLIKPKCQVIYYPLNLERIDNYLFSVEKNDIKELHIIWPHRWEWDKNPEAFYKALCVMENKSLPFKLSIVGESFDKKPEVFHQICTRFGSRLLHIGYVQEPDNYYRLLYNGDVVVSTALHEFFGVSVLEAVYCGCVPVVPRRLSYKELYDGKVLEMYDTEDELCMILEKLCKMKQEQGKLLHNYKDLALQFESTNWCRNLLKMINDEPGIETEDSSA